MRMRITTATRRRITTITAIGTVSWVDFENVGHSELELLRLSGLEGVGEHVGVSEFVVVVVSGLVVVVVSGLEVVWFSELSVIARRVY